MTQITRRDTCVFFHGSTPWRGSSLSALRARWTTPQKIRVISMIEAPKIMPSAIRKVIFRNGSPGCNQPMLTKYGTRALAMRPPTSAGTPTRAPTTIPAPMVDIERPVAPSHAILAVPKPPARPVNRPPPSVATERLRSSGSGQRAQDVRDRKTARIDEVKAIHEDRRIQHAPPRPIHADAQHVEHEVQRRRLGHPHPPHGLDHDRHGAHSCH